MSARPKVALITGITGQDGSYLAELLLDKGYVVHGIIRRSSSFNTGRVEHLYYNKNLKLHYGDMTDGTNLMSILAEARPAQAMRLKNYLFSSFFFETVATCNLQKRNLQIKIQSLWKFLASTLHVGFLWKWFSQTIFRRGNRSMRWGESRLEWAVLTLVQTALYLTPNKSFMCDPEDGDKGHCSELCCQKVLPGVALRLV